MRHTVLLFIFSILMSHAKHAVNFTHCAELARGLGRFLGTIHCGCAVGRGTAGAEETLKTEVGVPCFGGCGVGTARPFCIFILTRAPKRIHWRTSTKVCSSAMCTRCLVPHLNPGPRKLIDFGSVGEPCRQASSPVVQQHGAIRIGPCAV